MIGSAVAVGGGQQLADSLFAGAAVGAECTLLFKTFNRFAPFNRCALFKSSDFQRRIERLERLNDCNSSG